MNYLFIDWNPSLEALHLGSFGIRWYSLCWCLGLLCVYLLERRLYKKQGVEDKKFEPLFLYCFLGILIGSRLGHCLFYEPGYYLSSWHGVTEMILPIKFHGDDWSFVGYEGLASHGGTLGLMIALWFYMKHTGLKLRFILDNIAIVTPICAFFIRMGNLMNSEIIGRVTELPWGFRFFANRDALLTPQMNPDGTIARLADGSIVPLPRHPGQLYEALCYAAFFFVGWWFYKKRPQWVGTGFFFGLCLTLIFTARFCIEFTKEVQGGLDNGSLPIDMGQILSIPFVLLGVWCMVKAVRNK